MLPIAVDRPAGSAARAARSEADARGVAVVLIVAAWSGPSVFPTIGFVGYGRPSHPIEASNAVKSWIAKLWPAKLWLARGAWIALPVTAGTTVDRALRSWDAAPRVVALAVVCVTWTAGAIALFTPRPRSFTVLRIVAPAAALATAIAGFSATDNDFGILDAFSIAHALAAAIVVLGAEVATICADGASYGNEQRLPLRLPPQFRVVVVPTAALVVIGVGGGVPLLVADERWLAGAGAAVIGLPGAWFAARSLAALERRFVVLVPAGIVVADALTLVDPVLFPREHVVRLAATERPPGLPDATPGVLDLRLGAPGALELVTDEPAPIPCRDGRNGTKTVHADHVIWSPVKTAVVLDGWRAAHRVHS